MPEVQKVASSVPTHLQTNANSGKRGPMPTFLTHVSAIKFKISFFVFLMVLVLCLNVYLLLLFSIVNKIRELLVVAFSF